MQVEEMLKLYGECEREQKTIKGSDCSQCRLSKDVKLSIEAAAPGTVLSEITIQFSPCLLITEIARML